MDTRGHFAVPALSKVTRCRGVRQTLIPDRLQSLLSSRQQLSMAKDGFQTSGRSCNPRGALADPVSSTRADHETCAGYRGSCSLFKPTAENLACLGQWTGSRSPSTNSDQWSFGLAGSGYSTFTWSRVMAERVPHDASTTDAISPSALTGTLLLDRHQAAAALGVSSRTFEDLMNQPWMPRPVQLGPRLLRWSI